VTPFEGGDIVRAMSTTRDDGPEAEQEELVDPPDAAWIGPMFEELHRAMWLNSPNGPQRFRKLIEARNILPPVRATDEQIRLAYEMVCFVVGRLAGPYPGEELIFQRMAALLKDLGGVEAKRKMALGYVEWAVRGWASPEKRDNAIAVLLSILAKADARFRNLKAPQVRVELSRAPKRQAARIAAALAVAVGAFDDVVEDKSRKAFLSASKVSV